MQSDAGWEEYYDYIFPEDAANQPNLKLLAMAKMWKRQQLVDKDEEVPEKAPTAEETTSPSSDEPAAPPENDSDRNTATETEQEGTYDDRDDDSSSSSESDSEDEDDGEKEAKQSKSGDEDDKD